MKFHDDDFAIRGEFRGDSLVSLEVRIGNTDLYVDIYFDTKSLILHAMQTAPEQRTGDQDLLLETVQKWGDLADEQNEEWKREAL